jgi:hypothetical protein
MTKFILLLVLESCVPVETVTTLMPTLESASTTTGYETAYASDAGGVLTFTSASVTSAPEFEFPTATVSSVQSSIPSADVTPHLEDDFVTPLTIIRSSVISTDSTTLPTTTSIFSSSSTVSPSHSVPDIVLITTMSTTARTSTVVPVRHTNRSTLSDGEQTTFYSIAEQTVKTSSMKPPSTFPPLSPWFYVVIVAFVFVSVLLVLIVVLLVRARSQHKLCWTKHRCYYLPVTSMHQNGSGVHRVEASVAAALPKKLSTELAPLTSV